MPIAEDLPLVACHQLEAFEPVTIAGIREAFQNASPIQLQQSWRAEAEPDFKTAVVRTGWRNDALLVFAELDDTDIFNRATQLNERTWELGDVFEIFLQPEAEEGYVEFHVTPENQRLQMRFPAPRKPGQQIDGDAIRSRTWVEPDVNRWFVYAEIPAVSVTCRAGAVENQRWRFSFSRYDYTRGRSAPVLSSSSPHREARFHRLHEWGQLTFLD